VSKPDLSPLAARLVELLGKRTAEVLFRTGGKVYVPTRVNPNCRLARMIGTANTAKLMQHYAGRHLDMPQLTAQARAKRNAEIKRLSAAGVPKPEIALLSGLSVRQLHNILSR
jgi:hypothetical protein